MDRCRREIAAIEAEIRAGNPDRQGLCLALSDWSAELRILQDEERRQAENPAARTERNRRESDLDGIGSFAALGLCRSYSQAHLLAHSAREEAAHGMRLRPRRFHQFSQRGSIRPHQQFQDVRSLTAVAGAIGLFRGLGGFLWALGLFGRLALGGGNVGALWANTGLFVGFRLLSSRLGGSGFINSCIRVISFRGNRRGDDMNRSGGLKMQVNSVRIANESLR